MDSDELSYKFLRRIQQLEKNSPMLTNIDSDFYYKLSDYLNSLEMAAKNENDPQKNKLINDEVQNIKKIANSIYDLREKKIVQSALSKSRGGKPDIKNMLDVEKTMYDSIVELIMQSRRNIFNKKSSESNKNNKTITKPKNKKNYREIKNDRYIVRVTKDIPEFIGTDMKKYNLKKDDVLSLSEEMTVPLSKRGVIKQIK